MAGDLFFAAHVPAKSGPNASNRPLASEASPDVFSLREIEVARLVARGRASKEIASDLDLSTRTGEKHRANITDKISVCEVSSLVRSCQQNGLS